MPSKAETPTAAGRPPRGLDPLVAIIVCFGAVFILSQFFRASNAVIAKTLSAEFGLSPEALGLLTGLFFLSFGAAQIPVGMLFDRFGAAPHGARGAHRRDRGLDPLRPCGRRSDADGGPPAARPRLLGGADGLALPLRPVGARRILQHLDGADDRHRRRRRPAVDHAARRHRRRPRLARGLLGRGGADGGGRHRHLRPGAGPPVAGWRRPGPCRGVAGEPQRRPCRAGDAGVPDAHAHGVRLLSGGHYRARPLGRALSRGPARARADRRRQRTPGDGSHADRGEPRAGPAGAPAGHAQVAHSRPCRRRHRGARRARRAAGAPHLGGDRPPRPRRRLRVVQHHPRRATRARCCPIASPGAAWRSWRSPSWAGRRCCRRWAA